MPLRFTAPLVTLSALLALFSVIIPYAHAAVLLDENTYQPVTPIPAKTQTPAGNGNIPVQTPAGNGNIPSATQTPTPTASGDNSGTVLVNPLKGISSLKDLLNAILKALIDIGTIVLILAFVWVGFSFVRAQGKPEELKKARSAFMWTIIGGAILLGAQAISEVISATVKSLS